MAFENHLTSHSWLCADCITNIEAAYLKLEAWRRKAANGLIRGNLKDHTDNSQRDEDKMIHTSKDVRELLDDVKKVKSGD